MIEVGTYKDYDKIVVVKCSPEVQRRRIKERSALTDAQIDARIASQMPMEEKVKYGDYIVDNSGDIGTTRRQVEEIHRQMRAIA